MSITKTREVFSLPNVHYAYFYKVKLKYTLDRRCESISEKAVKGKRNAKSLNLDTLSLE